MMPDRPHHIVVVSSPIAVDESLRWPVGLLGETRGQAVVGMDIERVCTCVGGTWRVAGLSPTRGQGMVGAGREGQQGGRNLGMRPGWASDACQGAGC